MSSLACFLWWLVLGALLGLIGSWLIGRRFKRPEQVAAQNLVEKIVEKRVEVPVEKIVDRVVDRVVERVVEKPVEKIVERVVDRSVDSPNLLARIAALQAQVAAFGVVANPVERLVERVVERVVDKPVEKIVEKIVDRPVEKIVERVIEKRVDNPAHLTRIKALEREVGLIGGLRAQLLQLQSAPPKTVDRVVERIVDRPVEKIVEKVVEKPVDRIVEKIVDRPVEKIVEKIVERIVDRPVDRIVEKIVEKIVDRPVEKIVEKTVAKIVENPDQQSAAGLVELRTKFGDLERRTAQQNTRITHFEAEIARLTAAPLIDMAAAKAAGLTLKSADDLEIVEGIGPKIAELLREAGIITFMQLAQSTPARIRDILDKSGPNFRIANPDTWPEQAELAARNRWKALHALQSVLTAGVRSNGGGSGSGSTGASAAAAHTEETAQLKAQLAERDAEIKRLRVGPTIDLGAAKAAGFNLKGPDDLEIIEGIGPKIAELLVAGGIDTFTRLAVSTPQQIQDTLDRAGPHFRLAKAETWPEQADLAAHNRWRALASLQKMLIAGNRE